MLLLVGMRKKIIILVVLILFAGGYFLFSHKEGDKKEDSAATRHDTESEPVSLNDDDAAKYTIDNQSSIYYIVNKKRHLPLDYEPSGLTTPDVPLATEDSPKENMLRGEAARAAENLFKQAKASGYNMILASGYRSSSLQAFYYNQYVSRDGQEAADKYSARPGTSEHQTGLAFDIARKDRKCYLDICFADLVEGKWVAQNAYKYGFILRYQKGKENITGYQYEPWHFRYVGVDLAKKIHDSGKTLEEYFGLN